jgi:SAM-dependent methyltransferase
MSMYFADAGFECTLLDSSIEALRTATDLFGQNSLEANVHVADALALPFPAGVFDVVFSIGLLEHFADIGPPLAEQVRVLRSGGCLLVYVVPDNPENVQAEFEWVNEILRTYNDPVVGAESRKEETYRSSYGAAPYRTMLEGLGLGAVTSTGVYPLPMISPSPQFPFTLNPPEAEKVLVDHFTEVILKSRSGWLCDEKYGQAFLVWGFKA